MRLDFDQDEIKLLSTADNWGPYTFDFTNILPTGNSISSVTLTAYDSATDTDRTTDIIESGSVSLSSPEISVRFQYPGASLTGYHYLVFDITLSASSEKNGFVWGYLFVE